MNHPTAYVKAALQDFALHKNTSVPLWSCYRGFLFAAYKWKWLQKFRSGFPLERGIARLDFKKIKVCIKTPLKRGDGVLKPLLINSDLSSAATPL